MPIFMDIHIAPGVTPRQVAEAHLKDVDIQDKYYCKAMTYWMDEDKGCVFCLIEAPDKESVRTMHEKAHGLIPSDIIQVNVDVVKSFLGRIQDPADPIRIPEANLSVFSEPAFRVILVTRTMDSRLLRHAVGNERARELLLLYSTVVREKAREFAGSEVYLREDGFVFSFTSGFKALECAVGIQKLLNSTSSMMGLTIALHAGVPVNNHPSLFGSTLRFAGFMSAVGKPGQISVSAVVRNLFRDNDWSFTINKELIRILSPAEEAFLEALIDTLEAHWNNPEIDVPDLCRIMSLSKSNLYRKCMALTGMAPNMLLREYRLLRSLEFLRDEKRNISQTTFDAGFSSPSYFTKCFQKRFGLQPQAYLKIRN